MRNKHKFPKPPHPHTLTPPYTLIFLLLLLAFTGFSQDPSQWRGPHRNGIYPETGLLRSWPAEGPKLLWHYEGLGDGHASATVTSDRIFTAGMTGTEGFIYCLSLDGKLLWKVKYGEEWNESWPGTRSTPQYLDGKLYFMSGFGLLQCFSSADGKVLWKTDLVKDYGMVNIKWGVTENFVMEDEKLFVTVGGPLHNVIALDRNTGKLVWSCPGNGEESAYCSPAVFRLFGRSLLVTQTASSILGIDAASGKLLWRHPQTNRYSVHANTPYFRDGFLYVVSGYGTGGVQLKLSADGSAKQEMWRNISLDHRMGGFVVLGDRIYGSDDANKAWYCVDWKTGADLYSSKILPRGVVIAADGLLYCYGDSGEMALVEPTPSGFVKKGSFKVPYGQQQHWAHPVIRNGKLYLRHGTSLMVYELKTN